MLFFRWAAFKTFWYLCSNAFSNAMSMGARLGSKEIMDCNYRAGYLELSAIWTWKSSSLSFTFSAARFAKL